MQMTDSAPRRTESPPDVAPEGRSGLLSRLLRFDDPDQVVGRVRRNSLALTALLALGIGVATGSAWQVGGLLASALLMMLNFQGMVAVSDALTSGTQSGPSPLQALFLMGRYVLLALVLCAIVLLPEVGPIPVALGLSNLVLAILLEALTQLFSGANSRS